MNIFKQSEENTKHTRGLETKQTVDEFQTSQLFY